MNKMNLTASKIQDKIAKFANPQKGKWLENYVKHHIQSRGVGIPQLRKILLEMDKEVRFTHMGIDVQIDILNELMRQKYTDEKLAAILYLQLFWQNTAVETQLELISNWFDRSYIWDWNVCDWLCVRVLTPLLEKHPSLVIDTLKRWNTDASIWKARASLVPFAQCKTIEDQRKTILAFSRKLIRRKERFCKTAVGWVLREVSRFDVDFVKKFLAENEPYTTKEVIKNATKYFKV
jgi:3-methyladenine DNA glycosylase AlkD